MTKKYAKILDDGGVLFAPRDFAGVSNWIEDEVAVLAEGFYPVETCDPPSGMVLKGYVLKNRIVTSLIAKSQMGNLYQRHKKAPPNQLKRPQESCFPAAPKHSEADLFSMRISPYVS